MADDQPSDEELERRRRWFETYVDLKRVTGEAKPGMHYSCPCCHCRTLDERGGYDICPVCFWEDDGQDDHNADLVTGGPNGCISLTDARENYLKIGACRPKDLPHVRPPTEKEKP
jgi:hypothetical protein